MASKVVNAREFVLKIEEIERSGKRNFTADEVKKMLMEAPTVDAHICHEKMPSTPVTPHGAETIRQFDNKTLMGQFIASVGYDFGTNYDPHFWPEWSPETTALWDEIQSRLKESRTMNFDDKGCIDELEKAIKNHRDIIKMTVERGGDLSTVSWRDGIIDGFKSAISSIKEHIRSEEQ